MKNLKPEEKKLAVFIVLFWLLCGLLTFLGEDTNERNYTLECVNAGERIFRCYEIGE